MGIQKAQGMLGVCLSHASNQTRLLLSTTMSLPCTHIIKCTAAQTMTGPFLPRMLYKSIQYSLSCYPLPCSKPDMSTASTQLIHALAASSATARRLDGLTIWNYPCTHSQADLRVKNAPLAHCGAETCVLHQTNAHATRTVQMNVKTVNPRTEQRQRNGGSIAAWQGNGKKPKPNPSPSPATGTGAGRASTCHPPRRRGKQQQPRRPHFGAPPESTQAVADAPPVLK
jgi:hypothetical protein